MKLTLDSSHITVLKNLDTLQRAQRCLEETGEYTWDVLREVADDFPIEDEPPFQFKLGKGGWLQADAFQNWEGTNLPLISVGIENFDVPSIITSNGKDGCRAYIFSQLLGNPAEALSRSLISQRLRKLQPPEGFFSASAEMHGYLFVKMLGSIEVDAFSSRADLNCYFRNPLNALAQWFKATAPTLESFRGLTLGSMPVSI